jgi:hypothetical protein
MLSTIDMNENKNMEYSCIRLDNLPDEILMIILKKLHNVEALYSLVGVNKRLNRIVTDSIFTSCLTLAIPVSNDGSFCRFTNAILDQFCEQILPKIYDKIKWLNLESSSIERILLCTSYPNLNSLGLYDLVLETTKDLFTGKIFFSNSFNN